MAKTFLTSIDLVGNELMNAAIHNLATAPASPKIGQIYFNTGSKIPMFWNGTAWTMFGHTEAEINTIVRATTLSGYTVGANSALGAEDTVLGAFGKLQAQINAIPRGTVTSVGLTVPTGLSVSGSPITSSGTLAISLASGYSIPTTAKQEQWDTAYSQRHTHSNKVVIDALTQGHIDVLNKLSIDANGDLKIDTNAYATGELSAYGVGSGTGGGSGVTALSELVDVSLTTPANGNVLVYNGTHWENKPQSAIVPDLSAYALKTYVDTAIANLVESAPETLDTLNELAAALGNDPNFATTITNQIAGKENAITAGTTAQYWRGDKTWQTLNTSVVPESGNLYFTNARVLATALTGYAVGANSALAATDTILSAFGKVQGQLNNKLASSATAVAATKLATARAFSIGGSTGLSAAAINFDGTANVALSLTGVLNTANGGTGLTDAKNGFTRKVVGTFTTSATSYTITHGLGTDVIAQVVTASAPFDVVECDIEMTSSTTTTFRFNVAPAANAYRYIIIG